MSVLIGGNEIDTAFVGPDEVQEIWVGDTQVWSNIFNLNFPGQWTSGVAGTVWTQSLVGSVAPSFPPASGGFRTSYIGVGAERWFSGAFRTTGYRHQSVTFDVQPNTTYRLNFNKIGQVQEFMGQGTGGVSLSVTLNNISGGGTIGGATWGGQSTTGIFSIVTQQSPYTVSRTPNGITYRQFTTPANCTQMSIRLDASTSRTQSGEDTLKFSEIYLEKV